MSNHNRNRALQRAARTLQERYKIKYTLALKVAKDVQGGMYLEEALKKHGVTSDSSERV